MPILTAIIHKLREYLTYLVAVYFLFPVLWGSYLVGIWASISVVSIFFNYKEFKKTDLFKVCFYSLPFFLVLLSIWVHPGNGDKYLERAMSFAIFPICIFISQLKMEKKQLMNLIGVFSAGCLILALKGIALFFLFNSNYQYDAQHDFIFRFRQEFNYNTGIAPTYASMYFGFAIIGLLLLRKKASSFYSGWMVLAGFLFATMMLLSAKMPILAFVVIVGILFIRKEIVGGLTNKWRWLIFSMVFISGISVLFIFTRWNELFTAYNYTTQNQLENSVGIRKGITQCGLELSRDYFLTGVGPQNVQTELNQCYTQFGGDDFTRHTFNSHNQYVDYVLSSGIWGIIILLLMMIVPLVKAIKGKDPLLLSFIILISLCMLTENILSRHSGVIFYCFMNAILLNRKKVA